ncbi:hypothetical protein CEE37_10880 [candidate division LCP-89 bacterium B3_LCP]|uniref:Helix-hairpin-helix DNA-binding motif class 1 domain-containing protein n=1 Tax=candidate division LCP-89 bacterium B3_LCP TaxID=2012998 RepID=A0A532UXV2_UNCL8|nr:MAG: hypothetical protein CEE37_10880 [candidate division LCP-89 bacterium B3_LCP]
MLWNHRNLLITTVFSISILSANVPVLNAQTEIDAVPWRLESGEQVDIPHRDKIDLNTADLEELLTVPLLNKTAALAIIAYRQLIGSFISIDDIRNIPGIDEGTFRVLGEYCYVQAPEEKTDIKYLIKYQQDDPLSDNVDKSPCRLGQKLTVKSDRGIEIGMGMEKDPGEEQFWDHSSFSMKIPLRNTGGDIFIGDYVLGFNHGLVIRTRRNMGLTSIAEGNLKSWPNGLRRYSSWDENIALRGVGLSYKILKPLEVDAWFSSRMRDAYLNSDDKITSFYLSGLHRTATEISHQDACQEDAWGAHLNWSIPHANLEAGATVAGLLWDHPFALGNEDLSSVSAGSFHIKYRDTDLTSMLETASDNRGNLAGIADVQSRSKWLRSALAIYHIDSDYFAPLASGLDFDQGKLNNRQGLYSHIIAVSHLSELTGFVHLYRFPRRTSDESWGGSDFSLRYGQKFPHILQMMVRSRWTQEEDIESSMKTSHWRMYGSVKTKLKGKGYLRAFSQACTSKQAEGVGALLGIDGTVVLNNHALFHLKTRCQAGYYNAGDYALRLYWAQYDQSRTIRFRPLWGEGVVLELSLNTSHREWGGLGFYALWDQSGRASGRQAYRTFSAVYSLSR